MHKILIPLIAALIVVPAFAQEHEHKGEHKHEHKGDGGHEGWHADYDAAAKVAVKEKKDLLVDFTGSDWCGWCKRLNKEVFDHEEWLTAAKKNFVLVALDFPRDPAIKAKVPTPKRNEELQKKYGVQGFPTILLMTNDGEVYGRTGYKEGGPKAYLKHMDEMRVEGKKKLATVKALSGEFAAAQGEQRTALISKAITTLGTMSNEDPGVTKIAEIAKHGLENEATAEAAVKALLKSGQADAGVYAKAEALDPKNEKGLYEQCVAAKAGNVRSEEDLKGAVEAIDKLVALGEIKDEDLAKQLYANAAFWNHRFLKNAEAAKKYAGMLKKVAGDDPRFKQLLDMIK